MTSYPHLLFNLFVRGGLRRLAGSQGHGSLCDLVPVHEQPTQMMILRPQWP